MSRPISRYKEDDFYTYTSKCRFTGEVLGTHHVLKSKFNKKPTDKELREKLSIIDERCDACEAQFGRFKDIERELKKRVVGGKKLLGKELREALKEADYKIQNIDKAVDTLRGKIER